MQQRDLRLLRERNRRRRLVQTRVTAARFVKREFFAILCARELESQESAS